MIDSQEFLGMAPKLGGGYVNPIRAINVDLNGPYLAPVPCPELICEKEDNIVQYTPVPSDQCCTRDACVEYAQDESNDVYTWYDEQEGLRIGTEDQFCNCLLYTSPSPRDQRGSRMPSSA